MTIKVDAFEDVELPGDCYEGLILRRFGPKHWVFLNTECEWVGCTENACKRYESTYQSIESGPAFDFLTEINLWFAWQVEMVVNGLPPDHAAENVRFAEAGWVPIPGMKYGGWQPGPELSKELYRKRDYFEVDELFK